MRKRRGDASGTPFKPGRTKTGGRKKGTRNKLPQEIRAFFKSVVHSPKFQDKLRERAEKGTLSGTELTLMLAYAIGKPKDVLEIERPPESPMREAVKLMTPQEIRVMAAVAARMIEARKALPAHSRLRQTRGPASEHRCADCGRPAQEWSLKKHVPAKYLRVDRTRAKIVRLIDGTPLGIYGEQEYSVRTEKDYQPRCRKCHAKYDAA